MLVEKVGDTVFFVRRENSPTELIPDVYGYGHTFPEAYTTWDGETKGSRSHQRVLRYQFGGLGVLLRFEADGYLGEKGDAEDEDNKPVKKAPIKPAARASLDDLIDLFSDSNVTPETPALTEAGITVVEGGAPVKQSRVFDLKTRAAWKKEKEDTLETEMGRLWVSQIPRFVMAYHTKGVFEDIEIIDAGAVVKKWEKAHAGDLACLAALLRRIIAAVGDRPDGKMEICRKAMGPLELCEQLADAGNALSPETQRRWTSAAPEPVSLADRRGRSDDGYQLDDDGHDD